MTWRERAFPVAGPHGGLVAVEGGEGAGRRGGGGAG